MSLSCSVYACPASARTLCPVRAAADKHSFLVGTCSLHEANELYVLEFDETTGQLDAASVYAHQDQVWAIEASSQDAELVVTSRQSQQQACSSSVTLWRMPATAGATDKAADLVEVAAVTRPENKQSYAHSIKWHPGSRDALLVAEGFAVSLYSISESTVTCAGKLSLSKTSATGAGAGESDSSWVGTGAVAWDPSVAGSNSAAGAHGPHVSIFDTRTMTATAELLNAHGGGAVRDVDYNPNKSHTLMTCGHDRACKIWDLRQPKAPIKVLSGHSHWASCCRYNPFHDQLLLTGGCDHGVVLWRATSASSTASSLGDGDAQSAAEASAAAAAAAATGAASPGAASSPSSADAPDAKVRVLDQHEDSVYALAWSAADAWVHASLSFDGRVVVDRVPTSEKYKILL